MSDNEDSQLDDLFRASRTTPPDTSHAEFGFETRLMARIREEREQSGWLAAWAWKLCPVFACVVVALTVWVLGTTADTASDLRDAAVGASSDEVALAEYFNQPNL
jgi:hypothetical protein